jgi:hypothetical protein
VAPSTHDLAAPTGDHIATAREMTPPRVLEWLIARAVPACDRADVLAALADLHSERRRKSSRLHAQLWYARQAAGFVFRVPAERLRGWLSSRRRAASILDDLAVDVRFAFRQLARAPVFTFVAVVSVALGTGAVIATYTMYDAAMAPPPFARADQLYRVYTTDPFVTRAA